MSLFENFPYTNLHNLNLDWIVAKIVELDKTVDEFVLTTTIHYEGIWNDHTEYTKYSIVVNSDLNKFYLALKDTPPGILLTNSEYWQEVINIPLIHAEGVWSVNTAYTALALVTYGDAGYIAKTDVPAGTPLSNTAYWMELYNLNPQEDKQYIFIGDSYGSQTESWIPHVENALDLTEGVNAFSIARASYGFVGDTDHVENPTFLSLLNEIYDTIPNPGTITDIFVCGGHNDAYRLMTTELQTAIYAFVNRVYTLFPNAIIHIGFISYTGTNNVANYPYTINQYQSACEMKKVFYLTGVENCLHSMYYMKSDLTHPNAAGAYELGVSIVRAYLTGTSLNRIHTPFTTEFIPSGIAENGTPYQPTNTLYTQDGTVISGYVNFQFDFASGSRPTWTCTDEWQEIATFDITKSWIYGNDRKLTFAGELHVYDGTNYNRLPAMFNFYKGKLYACFPVKSDGSVTDRQITVRQFKIVRTSFTLPYLGT